MNDFLKVSGNIEVDLVNKADFADRFAARLGHVAGD